MYRCIGSCHSPWRGAGFLGLLFRFGALLAYGLLGGCEYDRHGEDVVRRRGNRSYLQQLDYDKSQALLGKANAEDAADDKLVVVLLAVWTLPGPVGM